MKYLRWLLFLGLLLAGAGVWSVALYERAHANRIYSGVTAFDRDLGGLTHAEAQALLRDAPGGTQPVFLRDGDRRYALERSELGISRDAEALLDAAFAVGRDSSWSGNLREQARALLYGKQVSAGLMLDEGAAHVALRRLARRVERPARDASVFRIGLEVVVEPAAIGRRLDVAETMERLRQALLEGNQQDVEVELAVYDVMPVVQDAGDVPAQLRAILASPLRLTLNDRAWLETGRSGAGLALVPVSQERVWFLDTAFLASLVTTRQVKNGDGPARLSIVVDDAILTAFLNEVASQVARPPRDARFHFDEKTARLTPLAASQDGRALDVPATLNRIKEVLASENRSVPLVVRTVKPAVALEDAGKFTIKELVVAGMTSFKGSSAERVQNITLASAQFRGIVIAPGQEFSFNQYLGEVLDANGYAPAYVIVGDRTAVGIGGGVCQVSTTAFRAAFFGGYRITQRQAHGYTVRYYEPPVGLDATVFSPYVDFRFVNDTPHYLLIQPAIDYKASTLTFNFYGTKNNRTVEMEGPVVSNVIQHGPPVYEDDPSLPVGVVKQIDFANDGKRAVIERTVKEGDKVIHQDRFVSVYRPWQARYLVGTKRV